MKDILLKAQNDLFSLRVAGICLNGGKILLHKTSNNEGYTLPGGHVAFFETAEQSIIREFSEETGVDVWLGKLKWIGENFFNQGNYPCHQICFYYTVFLLDAGITKNRKFIGNEHNKPIHFEWVPLSSIDRIKLYPENIKTLLKDLHNDDIKHFVSQRKTAEKSSYLR